MEGITMSLNPLPTIKSGARGPYVSYCQNLLNAGSAGQGCLWVDGIFGPKIDGVVGGATWTALEAGPPPIKKRPSVALPRVPESGGL